MPFTVQCKCRHDEMDILLKGKRKLASAPQSSTKLTFGVANLATIYIYAKMKHFGWQDR